MSQPPSWLEDDGNDVSGLAPLTEQQTIVDVRRTSAQTLHSAGSSDGPLSETRDDVVVTGTGVHGGKSLLHSRRLHGDASGRVSASPPVSLVSNDSISLILVPTTRASTLSPDGGGAGGSGHLVPGSLISGIRPLSVGSLGSISPQLGSVSGNASLEYQLSALKEKRRQRSIAQSAAIEDALAAGSVESPAMVSSTNTEGGAVVGASPPPTPPPSGSAASSFGRRPRGGGGGAAAVAGASSNSLTSNASGNGVGNSASTSSISSQLLSNNGSYASASAAPPPAKHGSLEKIVGNLQEKVPWDTQSKAIAVLRDRLLLLGGTVVGGAAAAPGGLSALQSFTEELRNGGNCLMPPLVKGLLGICDNARSSLAKSALDTVGLLCSKLGSVRTASVVSPITVDAFADQIAAKLVSRAGGASKFLIDSCMFSLRELISSIHPLRAFAAIFAMSVPIVAMPKTEKSKALIGDGLSYCFECSSPATFTTQPPPSAAASPAKLSGSAAAAAPNTFEMMTLPVILAKSTVVVEVLVHDAWADVRDAGRRVGLCCAQLLADIQSASPDGSLRINVDAIIKSNCESSQNVDKVLTAFGRETAAAKRKKSAAAAAAADADDETPRKSLQSALTDEAGDDRSPPSPLAVAKDRRQTLPPPPDEAKDSSDSAAPPPKPAPPKQQHPSQKNPRDAPPPGAASPASGGAARRKSTNGAAPAPTTQASGATPQTARAVGGKAPASSAPSTPKTPPPPQTANSNSGGAPGGQRGRPAPVAAGKRAGQPPRRSETANSEADESVTATTPPPPKPLAATRRPSDEQKRAPAVPSKAPPAGSSAKAPVSKTVVNGVTIPAVPIASPAAGNLDAPFSNGTFAMDGITSPRALISPKAFTNTLGKEMAQHGAFTLPLFAAQEGNFQERFEAISRIYKICEDRILARRKLSFDEATSASAGETMMERSARSDAVDEPTGLALCDVVALRCADTNNKVQLAALECLPSLLKIVPRTCVDATAPKFVSCLTTSLSSGYPDVASKARIAMRSVVRNCSVLEANSLMYTVATTAVSVRNEHAKVVLTELMIDLVHRQLELAKSKRTAADADVEATLQAISEGSIAKRRRESKGRELDSRFVFEMALKLLTDKREAVATKANVLLLAIRDCLLSEKQILDHPDLDRELWKSMKKLFDDNPVGTSVAAVDAPPQ